MDQAQAYEMRVLTLKRWALPHNILLKKLPREEGYRYGDYVAFQNYHFIDIDKVTSYSFSEAYKLLKEKRDKQNSVVKNRRGKDGLQCRSGEGLDTSVRQSLTLLGRDTEFWSGGGRDELFISLIQLQNHIDMKPGQIEEAICEAFKNCGGRAALYFSLDYCDVVLFTKGIGFSELHECLWNLLFAGRRLVRDSVTIFCYQYDYLLECLGTKPDLRPKQLKAGETLSLAIDLNVLSLEKFKKLCFKLREIGSNCEIFQITGHYDVRILLHDVEAWERINVIESLDKYCRDSGRNGFVSYELVPVSEFSTQNEHLVNSSKKSKKSNSFKTYQQFEALIRDIYEAFLVFGAETTPEQKGQQMRIAELYRSLLVLHMSKLSDEFVLSILPAMTELRHICKKYRDDFDAAVGYEDSERIRHGILKRLSELHGNFFHALTMLVQCTMHSERQWIQAPAFNSTVFDIPPKLLAFYSAITFFAAQELSDNSKFSYSFLIVPDFKNDIYVRSITQQADNYYNSDASGSNKLLLISLDEEIFYNPSDVIEIVCHEVAHHVGGNARCRNFRAEQIFNSVAMYALAASLDCFDGGNALMSQLAKTLGRLLLCEYMEYREDDTRSKYKCFLADIARFLTMRQALNGLFTSPRFKENLQAEFRETLCCADDSSLRMLADAFDDELDTVYFSNLCAGDTNVRRAACDVLSGCVVLKLSLKIYEIFHSLDHQQFEHMVSYFEEMLQAYSEAYADMRMLELLGISSVDAYDKIAERYLHEPDPSDLQKCLRYNAVLLSNVCTDVSGKPRQAMPDGYEGTALGQVTEYILARMADYLSHCRATRIGRPKLKSYQEGISGDNAYLQIGTINSAVEQYQKKMIDLYRKSTNGEIPPGINSGAVYTPSRSPL